jgi:hypothetical protein
MIKMVSAFTEEMDDCDAAVSEVLSQLGLENSLMKNSIGILHCYHEFVDNGIVRALSEKLPFDTIGTTVPYVCLHGKTSSMGLMLNVLTSDDVSFAAGLSGPLDSGRLAQSTEKLCADVSAKLKDGEKPSMLMPFAPFLHILKLSGDEFVDVISGCFPNVPTFGSFSFSEEIDFSKCYLLYNGESYATAAGLIALAGEVNPSFLTIAVPEKNIVGEMATVTQSTGNIIHRINDMPAKDYAISIGLIEPKDDLIKIYATPIIAKLGDGSTVVRVCVGEDEHGGAIMGGHVPEGTKIGFTMLELSDAISTSGEISKKAKEILEGRSVIIYSCMARLEFLGANQRELEAKTICDVMGDTDSFYLAYAGGEVFPQLLPGGKFANHLQNYSLILCVL